MAARIPAFQVRFTKTGSTRAGSRARFHLVAGCLDAMQGEPYRTNARGPGASSSSASRQNVSQDPIFVVEQQYTAVVVANFDDIGSGGNICNGETVVCAK